MEAINNMLQHMPIPEDLFLVVASIMLLFAVFGLCDLWIWVQERFFEKGDDADDPK